MKVEGISAQPKRLTAMLNLSVMQMRGCSVLTLVFPVAMDHNGSPELIGTHLLPKLSIKTGLFMSKYS